MSGPFKMKGGSPFTQKTHPKHPVIPPTEEQKKTSKGTLRKPGKFDRIDNWRDRLVAKIKEKFQ